MKLSETAPILVVDDFEMIRVLVKRSLMELGLNNVTEAVDGMDAFAKLTTAHQGHTPFQLIFLDWNMPRMNGIEFLKKCRESELFLNIPIIMLTAEREQKAVMEALKAGVTDYVVKPFAPKILLDKMSKHGLMDAKAS